MRTPTSWAGLDVLTLTLASNPTVAGVDRPAQLAALSLAAFVTVTVELAPTGLLPLVAADLGVSSSAAGALVGGWALTIAVSSLALVRLTARFDRQRIIGFGVLLAAAATVATACAPTLGSAVAARIVGAAAHGVVWALLVPHVSSLVSPAHLGRAVAVVLAGPTVATVAGVPLVTFLGGPLGWRWALGVLAGLAVVASLPLLRPGGARAAQPSGRGWWRDPTAGTVLRLSGATALLLAGHFTAATFTAVLLTTRAGFGQAAVAPLLVVYGAAGVAGLAASGRLSDRRPRAALPLAATLFVLGLAALALVNLGVVAAVLVLTLWGFAIGMLPPVFQVAVTRRAAPAIRGEAGAVAITALNLGIAVGSTLGGVALAAGGTGLLLVVAVVPAVVGTLLLWIMTPRTTQNGPVGESDRAVRTSCDQSSCDQSR